MKSLPVRQFMVEIVGNDFKMTLKQNWNSTYF